MLVRCAQCGYQNNPYYRFCGMCGVTLPAVGTAVTPPAHESVPPPAPAPHRPSSARDHPRNLDYLLEEEPHGGRWRMILALALLVVSIGLLVWHWRRDGYPWAAGQSSVSNSVDSPPSVVPGVSTTGTPEAKPAAHPAPAPADANVEPQPPATAPPASEPAAVPESKAAATGEAQQDGSHPLTSAAKPDDNNPASDQSPPAPVPSKPAPAVPRPSKSAQPVPAFGSDDRVALAEKYLYGNGVPQDCERAQKELETAARRLNPKAESTLGAIYASGHCVSRDLPTAYRWFARALRDDPSNPRIERDLEQVWRQMTPGEKQIALRGGQ